MNTIIKTIYLEDSKYEFIVGIYQNKMDDGHMEPLEKWLDNNIKKEIFTTKADSIMSIYIKKNNNNKSRIIGYVHTNLYINFYNDTKRNIDTLLKYQYSAKINKFIDVVKFGIDTGWKIFSEYLSRGYSINQIAHSAGIFIEETEQGKGFGELLYSLRYDLIKSLGIKVLIMETTNIKSRSLAIKLGFSNNSDEKYQYEKNGIDISYIDKFTNTTQNDYFMVHHKEL